MHISSRFSLIIYNAISFDFVFVGEIKGFHAILMILAKIVANNNDFTLFLNVGSFSIAFLCNHPWLHFSENLVICLRF